MSVVRSPAERITIAKNSVCVRFFLMDPDRDVFSIEANGREWFQVAEDDLDDLICVLTELKGVLDGDPQGTRTVRSSQ